MSLEPESIGEAAEQRTWNEAERRRQSAILDLYNELHQYGLRIVFWCLSGIGIAAAGFLFWIMLSVVVEYSGSGWLADWQIAAISTAAEGFMDAIAGLGIGGFIWLYVYRRVMSRSRRRSDDIGPGRREDDDGDDDDLISAISPRPR